MFSRNGVSKQFKIRIVDKVTGATTDHTFSFKHQALTEWTREKWIYHEFNDGTVEQQFQWLKHYFEINWAELIIGDDSDKLKEVRNAEFRGDGLILTPHLDVPRRNFNIISFKNDNGDSEEINFSQMINQTDSPGNKGTVMLYVTRGPVSSWETVDPSTLAGVLHKRIQRIN